MSRLCDAITGLKRSGMKIWHFMITLLSVCFFLSATGNERAYGGSAIDDNTIVQTDQAGSVAAHSGGYGWDSRGAVFAYRSNDGRINGNLGLILFCNEYGEAVNGMWGSWGNRFPDWWARMLAEKIRKTTPESEIRALRDAFADRMTFECRWAIAIGIKDTSIVERGPYYTLRTDGTLRPAHNVDTSKLDPPERLFIGNEMADSFSYIVPGGRWGASSQASFAERNPYIYRVRIESYDINIYATDCLECAKARRKAGYHCPHNDRELMLKDVPIDYNGTKYEGENSFVWKGQTVTYKAPKIKGYTRISGGDDLSGLNGKASKGSLMLEGDSRIYLLYDKKETDTAGNENTVTESGGGISVRYSESVADVEIYSDVFDVPAAIPSTETVKISASFNDRIYGINAERISGTESFDVTVAFPYRLTWTDEDDTLREETGYTYRTVTVNRSYEFLHLISLEYYVFDKFTVENPATEPRKITVTAGDAGIDLPVAGTPVVYGDGSAAIGGNIGYPSCYSLSVTADVIIEAEGETEKPGIPEISYDMAYPYASSAVGSMLCRNDEFEIDNINVLGTKGWFEYGAGSTALNVEEPEPLELDSGEILGEDRISIPAATRNGIYESPQGTIEYRLAASYNAPGDIESVIRVAVNPVRVHTPVACEVKVSECGNGFINAGYLQEEVNSADFDIAIVQGKASGPGTKGSEHNSEDLEIRISNRGDHPVYGRALSADYDYSVNVGGTNGGTYTGGNYLKFPFDVYADTGDDHDEGNDILVKKNEWFRCDNHVRFYPAETVAEGIYEIEACSCAVNSTGPDDYVGDRPGGVNSSAEDYVAYDSFRIYVGSKIYGLKLCDITSSYEWKGVFPAYDYPVGICNELGLTTGRDAKLTMPLINGSHPAKNRQNIGALKAGYKWSFRLNTTGYRMGFEGSGIRIVSSFWHVTADGGRREAYVYSVEKGKPVRFTGEITITEPSDKTGGLQKWDFTYSLPKTMYITDTDGIRIKDGFLAVNFRITAFDSTGTEYLYYASPRTACNMWQTEGQSLNKRDFSGKEYRFEYGDIALVYTDRSMDDDYGIDHQN